MDVELDEYKKAVKETKMFYDRFAQYYDEFVPPKEMRTKRVDNMVAFIREKTGNMKDRLRILELGCGTASYAIPLARRGHHVTGVDISDEMRVLAVKKLGEQPPACFEYILSDWLTALGSWESEFDCILCIGNSLIHNPPSSLHRIFGQSLRTLKPKGIVILNGRRFEQELEMNEGVDTSQNEICRAGGPVNVPGEEQAFALRFMLMTKVQLEQATKTAITFYTYDNYKSDCRRFVCHRILFDNAKAIESKPLSYDTWSTKNYFIFKDDVITTLKKCNYFSVKEENPDPEHISLDKNWYIVAQK